MWLMPYGLTTLKTLSNKQCLMDCKITCRFKEDKIMTRFDLTPLFRHSVGFDHLERLLDGMTQVDDTSGGYPPYNIESSGENNYLIELAVAGFTDKDLSITVENGILEIEGNRETTEGQYLHRGIAARSFKRNFRLADFVEVENASLENGILRIDLVRIVPEELRPKKIEIKTDHSNNKKSKSSSKLINGEAA